MSDHISRGLTDAQREARRGFIGGSDANILMAGDAERIFELWENKTGRREDDDLSNVLHVQIGIATESLNRVWWEMTSGQSVTHSGEQRVHPSIPFMGCTLDGITMTHTGQPAIFEGKHVNAFSKINEVIQDYMPQIHHNAAVVGSNYAVLSVFVGTLKYDWTEIETDALYLMELMEREREFWSCVEADKPPGDMPAVAAPVPPEQWRTISMEGHNEWANHAADWLEHGDAAKRFEVAAKGIKGLMVADVGFAYGHGIEVKRSKAGALRIGAQK